MILVIDNYDSFTYNIVQYLGRLSQTVKVIRNDQFELSEIEDMQPAAIVLSPGPGHPSEAGKTCDVIQYFKDKIPMMGVCLGHQAIGLVEGATVNEAKRQLHGKISEVALESDHLFKGLGSAMEVVRYHSLVIDKTTCPDSLEIISTDEHGEIMAIKHKVYPVYGVQFHPESYSTRDGMKILENFITIAKTYQEESSLRQEGVQCITQVNS